MGKWFRQLRIGKKIGFGFGIVGLLFLGVIWGYHSTLPQALTDYRQLYDTHAPEPERPPIPAWRKPVGGRKLGPVLARRAR